MTVRFSLRPAPDKPFFKRPPIKRVCKNHDAQSMALAVNPAFVVEPGLLNMKVTRESPNRAI